MSMRRLTLGLLALSLAGCTNLSPSQINQASKLLAQFGLSLKTVNAETGEEEILDKQDIKSVKDDAGKAIDYAFDDSGKMVFRPNKPGKQTVTVELQDGTQREFELEGQEGDSPIEGEVGFIPDAVGQNVTSEVAIGGKVDVVRKQKEQQQQFADRRVHLTFNGGGLEGLRPETLAAVFFDLNQLPYGAAMVEPDGTLKMAPEVFFMVRAYREKMGSFPTLTVAYKRPDIGQVQIIKAELDSLPSLPKIEPAQGGVLLKPEMFATDQKLDLLIIDDQLATSFEEYKRDNGLMGPVYAGAPEIKPLTPEQQAAQQQQQLNRTVLLKLARPGLQAQAVKAVFIGRFDAPIGAPLIVASDDRGVSFRPEYVFALATARKRLFDNREFPWTRVAYIDGNVLKVWRFRPMTPPTWFGGLDRFTGPMPLIQTDGPIKPGTGGAMPEIPWNLPNLVLPRFEDLGPNPAFEASAVESQVPMVVDNLDRYRMDLLQSGDRNP
ncbi:MAG: hypothetical protein VKP72_05345 [bacterium]|nr:hypothetical protein [bacterium]